MENKDSQLLKALVTAMEQFYENNPEFVGTGFDAEGEEYKDFADIYKRCVERVKEMD